MKPIDAGPDINRAEFERACSLLPPEFVWGLPVTPRLVLDVAEATLLSASKPAAPEGWKLAPDHADADAIVTSLYRRFKDWSKRGFGPDDVTWCEVKADVLAMLAASPAAPAQSDESVPNTLAGFKAAFFNVSKRALTEQDIFDAGVRSGMARASQPSHTAVVLDDERAAQPVVLTNEELNALTKERFGNMHQMYAEGFRRLMRTAIEENAKKARAVSPQPVAQPVEKTRVCSHNYVNGQCTKCDCISAGE